MGGKVIAKADIAIVGAGVMGASIAFHLSKQSDKKVVLIDQYRPLGGMSGRSFGQIRLHYSNQLLLEMANRGYSYFRNWKSEVGYGDSGYRALGYLLLVVENQLEALRRNIDLAASINIDTRFVEPQEIKKIEPALDVDGLVGGVFDPAGGYIDITRIVLSFLTAVQERGTRLMSGVTVDGLETSGDRFTGVSTNVGTITAPTIVLATGAWTNHLLEPLGISVPIEGRRLDTMYMTLQPQSPQIGTCITDGNSNVVVRPDMGRSILAAAYPAQMPISDDPADEGSKKADLEHVGRIRASFAQRIPALQDAIPAQSVSGTFDITPDWHPILGWVPNFEGLYLAAGFSGHGLKLSPSVGETVAAEVTGKTPPFDVHSLRMERFQDNEPMFLAYGPGGRA